MEIWQIMMAVTAVLTLIGTMIGMWTNLNTRISLIENNMEQLDKKQMAIIDEIKLTNQIIWKKLDSIDCKLDFFYLLFYRGEMSIFAGQKQAKSGILLLLFFVLLLYYLLHTGNQ